MTDESIDRFNRGICGRAGLVGAILSFVLAGAVVLIEVVRRMSE